MTKKMDEEIIRTDKAFTQLFNQKSIAFQIKNFVFYYSTKKKTYVIVDKCYVKNVKIIAMSSLQNINVRLKKI